MELGGQLAKCLRVVGRHFFSDTNVKLSSIALMIKGPYLIFVTDAQTASV